MMKTNKNRIAVAILLLFGGLTATGASAQDNQLVTCSSNCDNAVDGPGAVDDGVVIVEVGQTNDDGTVTDTVTLEEVPGEAVNTEGADAMGVQNSGSDQASTSGGTRVEVSYLDSGETGKDEDPVVWNLRIPEGYTLNVEGYQVIVRLNDAQGTEVASNTDPTVQGRGLFGSFPGGRSYTVQITDGAWAIVPADNAQADICRRWNNNVGNARDMLFGPPEWGADFCGVTDEYNPETTSPGEPIVTTENQQVDDTVIEEVDDVQGPPAPTGERRETGDGGTLRFEAGDRVAGVDIVLDSGVSYMGGDGTGNCWLNTPVGGTVTTGVINPTDDELPERVCGS